MWLTSSPGCALIGGHATLASRLVEGGSATRIHKEVRSRFGLAQTAALHRVLLEHLALVLIRAHRARLLGRKTHSILEQDCSLTLLLLGMILAL